MSCQYVQVWWRLLHWSKSRKPVSLQVWRVIALHNALCTYTDALYLLLADSTAPTMDSSNKFAVKMDVSTRGSASFEKKCAIASKKFNRWTNFSAKSIATFLAKASHPLLTQWLTKNSTAQTLPVRTVATATADPTLPNVVEILI